jgi:hypothetical protein
MRNAILTRSHMLVCIRTCAERSWRRGLLLSGRPAAGRASQTDVCSQPWTALLTWSWSSLKSDMTFISSASGAGAAMAQRCGCSERWTCLAAAPADCCSCCVPLPIPCRDGVPRCLCGTQRLCLLLPRAVGLPGLPLQSDRGWGPGCPSARAHCSCPGSTGNSR